MKKINLLAISITIILLLNISCKNNCKNFEDTNTGISKMLTELNEFNTLCYNGTDTACINTHARFTSFFSKINSNDCKNSTILSLPAIDFTKNSVLVFHTTIPGCMYFKREVITDTINNKVTYFIEPISCSCDFIAMDIETDHYNIALVPKIKDGYILDFILKEE